MMERVTWQSQDWVNGAEYINREIKTKTDLTPT